MVSELQGLLGVLRALHWLHWTAHWQSQGLSQYGDHQLFERLYTGVVDEIDALAEKIVAYGVTASVSPTLSIQRAAIWLQTWTEGESTVTPDMALQAERDLQSVLSDVFHAVKGKSLGLDDFLQGLANDHETNIYLLQQRCERA